MLLLVTVVVAGLMAVVDVVMLAEVVVLLRLTSAVSTPARPIPTPPSSNEVGASDADSLSDKIPPQPPPMLSSADDEAQLVFDSEAFNDVEVVLSACISHICSCRMSSW